MRIRCFTTLGCAAALLAPSVMPLAAQAQDANSAGPVLRVEFTDGKPVHLREKRRVEEIIDSGMIPMVRETVVVRDMTLTSQGKTDDGDWKVEWKFDRVLGSITSPLATETFDTKKGRSGESNLLIEPLVAIAGTSFTVTISDRGVVKAVAGEDDALKLATERYGDEADMYRMVLRDAFRAESVRRELQFVISAAPLPEGAITPDIDWTVAGALTGPVGVTWTFRQKITPSGGYNDIAEFEATGEGGAIVNERRTSGTGLLLDDGIPDEYFVSMSYAIARSDGLPLANYTSFWVTAAAEDDTGATRTYRQRAKYVVTRVFEEELPGVQRSDRMPRVELISSWHPQYYLEQLRWMRAKGLLYAGSEEPDAARETFTAARTLAAELVAGKLDDIAETDGKPRNWLMSWVALSNDLASVELDLESWDAAIAAWEAIAAHEAVVKAAEGGDGELIWERVRAGVMIAQALEAKGEIEPALTRFADATAEATAGRRAVPDDAGLGRAHAWALERWSSALEDSGDAKGALAKAEEAIAVRDALAAEPGRSPGEIRDLVDRLWELANLALTAGDAKKAAALLERAGAEVQALFEHHDSFRAYHADIVQRRDDCLLIDAGGESSGPAQSIRLAHMLVPMKRHADAHEQYELAFVDESIRDDWENHNLYNAACNAALAHATATGEDKARYATAALAWLKPHVARLRGFAEGDDEEYRDGALSYLEWVREGDPDLESLREMPEFEALFE